MPTVAVGANPQARGTTLRAQGHPKTNQNRPFLIDIAAIRKRRNSSICNRSKFLIDSKLAVLEERKHMEGEEIIPCQGKAVRREEDSRKCIKRVKILIANE